MADYNITLDYSNTLIGMDQINKLIAERIHGAVGMAAQNIYELWTDRVKKAPGIWQKERTDYIHSLKQGYTGPFSARVWTDYKIAEEIETGRPARDLKRMLQTSNKTRQGKNGKYLIIPFRNGVPGGDGHSSNARQMPTNIYAAARKLPISSVIGSTTRVSATGAIVPRSIYKYGGEKPSDSRLPAGLAPKLKPTHASDPYAGMMRFDTSTGKSKSSNYLTMRVMTERSTGWIIGAKPGQYIARDVAADAQPDVSAIVAAAIEG